MFMHTVLATALLAGVTCGEAPTPVPTPLEVADRLEQRHSSVNDYRYVMESRIEGEKETREGRYRIWVRKPDLFRLKVEKGSHGGSTIAVNKKGKVRARPGGVLGKIVAKTMDKTDARLRSPRGGYPWESTFESYYRKLRNRIAVALKAETLTTADEPDRLTISVTYQEPETGKTLTEQWGVDSANWLLTSRDIFEDGKQVERIRFSDYQENLGLTESFFDR